MGWTFSPVIGPAIHSAGNAATSAPSVWKIRVVLAFWSAQTIWMPNNAKHMFQMCKFAQRAPCETPFP